MSCLPLVKDQYNKDNKTPPKSLLIYHYHRQTLHNTWITRRVSNMGPQPKHKTICILCFDKTHMSVAQEFFKHYTDACDAILLTKALWHVLILHHDNVKPSAFHCQYQTKRSLPSLFFCCCLFSVLLLRTKIDVGETLTRDLDAILTKSKMYNAAKEQKIGLQSRWMMPQNHSPIWKKIKLGRRNSDYFSINL